MRAVPGQSSRAGGRAASRNRGLVSPDEHAGAAAALSVPSSACFTVDGSLAIHSRNQAAARLLGSALSLDAIDPCGKLAARTQQALKRGSAAKVRLRIGARTFEAGIDPGARAGGKRALIVLHDVTALARSAAKWKDAAAKARQQIERQAAALDGLSAHIALLDHAGGIVTLNRRGREFAEAGGLSARQCNGGADFAKLFTGLYGDDPGDAPGLAEAIASVLRGERDSFTADVSSPAPRRWFRRVVTALEPAARLRGVMVAHFDITDQVRLAEEMNRQAAALQSAANSIFIVDARGRIDWANEAFLRSSGPLPRGRTGSRRLAGPEFAKIAESCLSTGQPWAGEVTTRRKDGLAKTVEQTVTPIPNPAGEVTHFVVVQEDITHHRQAQQRMMYMAEHDDLTGLLNRKSFHDRLRLSIEQHRSMESSLAVLFLDLDRFKDANDSLGHRAGDLILIEVARRLRFALRESDVLARFGGDEFAVLLGRAGTRERTARAIERVRASLMRPLEIGGRTVSISASIGATVFPDDGATHEDLLRNADLAMYRAKAEGRQGYRFYDRRLETEMGERVAVERDLRNSIGTPDLWIAYQPQWDIRTGRINGAESLLRWNPAARSGIPMGRIVSIAEESGLILPIGQWVVEKSLAQLRAWRRTVNRALQMSINLSAVQLNRQDVAAMFTQPIRGRQVEAAALKAEITESVLLDQSARVAGALQALHEAGVGLILDDFGTGYSSLSYLRRFPIEGVKIDASFVKGIGCRKPDEAIVNGIVQLVHSLGLTAVAEGVETEAQLAFLRDIGCDSAQGFLLSPAVPPAEFERLLSLDLLPR